MAITVLTDASITSDSRTLTWTIPSLSAGDVVVVDVLTWDPANTMNNPSGTGLAFGTPNIALSAAGHDRIYVWAMAATAGGTSVAVTCSVLAGGASIHNGVLYVCPAADGYSLAATPNTASNAAGSSATLSGASGNLGIVAVGDWNGGTGASRAWLASATEDLYQFSSTNNTQYGAHCTLTGATTSVGLSTPTAASFNTAAIEVLKSAGSTPSIPELVMAPPRY